MFPQEPRSKVDFNKNIQRPWLRSIIDLAVIPVSMRKLHIIWVGVLSLVLAGCNRQAYNSLPRSITVVPPWFSNYPSFANSYGFKNLGTGYTPSTLFLSDNLADGGDVVAVALNGQVVLDNQRLHTPDNEPPHPLVLALKEGANQIDIACRQDPDGLGCTLQAEVSNTTAGQGITTINEDYIPEGKFASFVVEYKPAK